MADVMNSLFGMTPESIQRQRDNELQARALQFAKLDPQQAAQMAFYTAGSRLGDAGAGLLGAKDPEMMRLQQRQGTMQGLDLTNPESLKQGIQMAMQNNDYALVSELTNRYQAVNKSALDADVQRSIITKNQRERAAADPFQKLLETGKYTPKSLAAYRESGDVNALELKTSDAKTQVVDTADGQLLINSATGEIIANVGKKPVKAGIGSEIAAGLSPIMGVIAKGQAQKSAEAGGTDVGKQTAAIEGKYTALNSVDDALKVVKKGIYAGGYGPLEEGLAKYSKGVLADKQRLVNTEEFRSYIGNVVIPRLTEFGGNDSVEELKYLKSVMAGETTMESKSIEKILGKAKENIERGIKRVQQQQQAIGEGRQLPTGPTGAKKTVTKTTRSGITYTEEVEE
jgi:hypothetical protein